MESNKNEANGTTPLYNLKAVVRETGLKPPTIRAWERRYGLPQPHRSDGGHRKYSGRDIEMLKWLVARQEEGMSISNAIDLWHSTVEHGEDPLHLDHGVFGEPVRMQDFALVTATGDQIEELRRAWLDACLAFNRPVAEQVLSRAFALFPPETVCTQLLQKGLAEIGQGWYDGDVSIQQEHFASELTIRRLEMLIAATPPPTRPERILISTAPGDYHIFSPLLLTYLLRRQGWDVIYLGANVPATQLAATVERLKPHLVIVSAQLLKTAAKLRRIAETLPKEGTALAFGGLIFNLSPSLRKLVPGEFLGETLEEAVLKVPRLIHERPAPEIDDARSGVYRRALSQFIERRALVESHVWGTFMATNKPTTHLTEMNQDLAETIIAALELQEIDLLGVDLDWIAGLLMGYRLPEELIVDYITIYYQAARIHLGEAVAGTDGTPDGRSGAIITGWLAQLAANARQPSLEGYHQFTV